MLQFAVDLSHTVPHSAQQICTVWHVQMSAMNQNQWSSVAQKKKTDKNRTKIAAMNNCNEMRKNDQTLILRQNGPNARCLARNQCRNSDVGSPMHNFVLRNLINLAITLRPISGP